MRTNDKLQAKRNRKFNLVKSLSLTVEFNVLQNE